MIFLKDNTLLKCRISPEDIKNRLLGHWGTCPGLIMVYAHLNHLIRKTGLDALYVVGPGVETSYLLFDKDSQMASIGHGAPAILSCLWLENSLSRYMPQYTRDKAGLAKLISQFSVPGGLPRYMRRFFFKTHSNCICYSHINAQTPGSIHEGGELGYALSVSFGAVMDHPDLVVACVVGDGEAESGPTATYV